MTSITFDIACEKCNKKFTITVNDAQQIRPTIMQVRTSHYCDKIDRRRD
jgi:hypothetical protein